MGATLGGGSSGGGSPSGGGSSGGGESGGGSGGGSGSAQALDDLDEAIKSRDVERIAKALKAHLLRGDAKAMEKFHSLPANLERQIANTVLASMTSQETSQLSGSPTGQQALGELGSSK